MNVWQVALPLGLILIECHAQEQPAFKAEVNLVSVTALVRSSNGELLTGLDKNDFEVLEDGIPQRVQFFARENDIPLSLGLIVDVSGSQDKFLKQHNRDVEKFLKAVLTPADRAVVICFGNRLRLVSDSTASIDQIMDELHGFSKGNRDFPEIGPHESREAGTALFDAVYFTTQDKLRQSDERRKAVLLFSDGEENSSEHDLLDTIEEVQNENTIVYPIRYTDIHHQKTHDRLSVPLFDTSESAAEPDTDDKFNARNKYGVRVMKHLASQSGGADYDGLHRNLEEVFSEIGAELHSLYSIGYLSTNTNHDGRFRKIAIRCKRANTIVRAKTGYYAR